MILAMPASRVCLSGHSIHEKTTVSSSLASTARLKSVTLPSGTAVPQLSTRRVAPACLKRSAAILAWRSEEHTSELQSLMRISYAVFCLKKKIYNVFLNDITTDTVRTPLHQTTPIRHMQSET